MEQYNFKAEINELMNMIIHNFYSSKDIFLRELLSNASDAINKLKYNSLTNASLLNNNNEFTIKLQLNDKNKTLVLEDTGIGMTRDDMISCLGTIAKSGTKEFIKRLSENDKSNGMIGMFGIGFYSAYLVADTVRVESRYAGSDETHSWESSANGSYTVQKVENTFSRGTRLTLFMKDDALDYLNNENIVKIIKKHSSYVTYPILLHTIETKEVPDDSVQVTDETDTNINIKTKSVTEEKWVKVNSEPIWSKQTSEVSSEEYQTFYKSLSNDKEDSLFHTHFKMEGQVEFTGLLYIPSNIPSDLFDIRNQKRNVKLYVKKVLINDNCKDLYPEWMNFLTGVVDSNDIPLNATRELLQQSKLLKQINKQLVKKTISMLNTLSENKEKYNKFYQMFDKNLKLGIHDDTNSRDSLIELLRYNTSKGELISFNEYKDRMKEKQPGIYYIGGDTLKNLENSPLVVKLRKMDYEILYMTDPIDEYINQHFKTYKDVKFINVAKDNLELPETDDVKQYEGLCKKLEELLKGKVTTVVVSNKIETIPAIVVNNFGMSSNMERILKAQAINNKSHNPMQEMMMNMKTLEINPSHPIMSKLNSVLGDKEVDSLDDYTKKLINVIYQSALLSGGYTLEDVNGYLQQMYEYIA